MASKKGTTRRYTSYRRVVVLVDIFTIRCDKLNQRMIFVADVAKGIVELKSVDKTIGDVEKTGKEKFRSIGKAVGIMGAAIGGACVAAGAALTKMVNDMADYSDDILTK